ncbi:MAG TPA: hypothetical protein VHS53_03265 [Mucilaginibacter sp.]|nr:hypothetical protein [Mucilaginibacter sp.]
MTGNFRRPFQTRRPALTLFNFIVIVNFFRLGHLFGPGYFLYFLFIILFFDGGIGNGRNERGIKMSNEMLVMGFTGAMSQPGGH